MAVVTEEPEEFYFPEPNYLPIDRTFLQRYIVQILEDAPYDQAVKYTYGQRLRSWFGQDQIKQVVNKLGMELDSASAVMNLWDVSDHNQGGSPCLNHIWVRIVDNELSLTATFRSNDMFSAWPANAMGLRQLQRHILNKVAEQRQRSLTMGPLITVSQSAHIYDDCWEDAENVIKSQYHKILQRRDYSDPAGSFVITVQDDSILVEHLTPGSGEPVNCYSGKSALMICRAIAADCPGLQTEHSLYLGLEMQKAEMAMKARVVYEQDRAIVP
jgi:thymidylate synthase